MQRKVKINGTNLTVSVPIYCQDWVNFLAVDSDGEIWMYSHTPLPARHNWLAGDDPLLDLDRLPAEGSDRNHHRIDMTGIDWRETLTEIDKGEAS